MADFMQAGVDKGDFMPHDKTTAMAIASIMVQSAGDAANVDEDTLYETRTGGVYQLGKNRTNAPTDQ